jgi:hypothetical protein
MVITACVPTEGWITSIFLVSRRDRLQEIQQHHLVNQSTLPQQTPSIKALHYNKLVNQSTSVQHTFNQSISLQIPPSIEQLRGTHLVHTAPYPSTRGHF